LLSFRQVSFETLPPVDWIFFYSQKGVHYFFKNLNKKKIILPKGIQWAGFGEMTAHAIEKQEVECGFAGTGHAKTTAPDFFKIAKNKKVLFPRAKHSKRSIQKLLEGQLDMQDLIVYDNFPKKNIQLDEFDVLVFTSPMNAEAYFQNKKIRKGQRFYAIGETTAKTLNKLGVKEVTVPKNPSMEEIAKLLVKEE